MSSRKCWSKACKWNKSLNWPKLHHKVSNKSFYIKNNELLMLKKQLEVVQAIANELDEVAIEVRFVVHPPHML